MSLYICTSCSQSISAFNPRVRCFTCDTIVDLCANCQLGERFVAPHTGVHQVYILKISGTKERPLHPGVVPASALGSMPKNVLTKPQLLPRAATVAPIPWSFTPPPGPPPPKTQASPSAYSPPKGGTTLSAPNRGPPIWKPFFNEQGLASPAFVELLSAVFKNLAPNNTGALTPEAFSDFWTAMGHTGEASPWQHEFDKHGGSRKDLADHALRNYYNVFSIDYRMGQRPAPARHVGVSCDGCNTQHFVGNRYTCTHAQCADYDLCEACHNEDIHPADHQFQLVGLPQGNVYPLITFSGLMDLTTLDILESQSPNVLCRPVLNAMLQHFKLFLERGPIPETGGILPDYPNTNVLERIRKAREAQAEERKIQEMRLQAQMETMKSQIDSNRLTAWGTLGWGP